MSVAWWPKPDIQWSRPILCGELMDLILTPRDTGEVQTLQISRMMMMMLLLPWQAEHF